MAESFVTSVIENSNETRNGTDTHVEESNDLDMMMIIHSTTASVGIIANLTVVVVFLNHKKFRRKIPNVFIINQASIFFALFGSYCRKPFSSLSCF